MKLQVWLGTIANKGWSRVRSLINKAMKGSEPFGDIIEQRCVILQLPEDAQGILKAYKKADISKH